MKRAPEGPEPRAVAGRMRRFDRTQRRLSWFWLLAMVAMLLLPPWLQGLPWHQQRVYGWLWAPPAPPASIDWRQLQMQWLVLAVGRILLLFLHERRVARKARLPVDDYAQVF